MAGVSLRLRQPGLPDLPLSRAGGGLSWFPVMWVVNWP
jgi:hypothetical protein